VWTGQTIEARCKEHMRHAWLNQPEKSTVVEHSINTTHHIDSDGTSKVGTANKIYGKSREGGHQDPATPQQF
jgi:hypothetical protein